MAADGEFRSQTKGEGHPPLKAARVVQRSTEPSRWKKLRERKQSGPGKTQNGQAQKCQLSKTSFYIIKTRKAGSINRRRDGEVSQLPSTHQSNTTLSKRRQALQACTSQQLQKLQQSGFRFFTMRRPRSITDKGCHYFRSEAKNTSKVESCGGGSSPQLGRICHSRPQFPGGIPSG